MDFRIDLTFFSGILEKTPEKKVESPREKGEPKL